MVAYRGAPTPASRTTRRLAPAAQVAMLHAGQTFVLRRSIDDRVVTTARDYAVWLGIAASFAVMTFSLDGGHSWYDDFAQYVMQAANTARLAPFEETLYAYHAGSAGVGPRLYPPVFPALLALPYRAFGLNLLMFKLVCLICSTAGLCIALALFRRQLSPLARWIFVLVLGFSPALWEFRDYIYSEHLFTPLFYLSILLMDKWYVQRSTIAGSAGHGLLLGVIVYLCYGTRVIGVVLFPAIVCCELLELWSRWRSGDAVRPSVVGSVALLTGAALVCLQSVFMPSSVDGYLILLNGLTVEIVAKNAVANATSLSYLWENGANEWVRRLGGAAFAVLAGVGFATANFPRPKPLGIVVAGYFCAVALWPEVAWLRIVWPLLPAFVFYLLVGARDLSSAIPTLKRAPTFAVLVFTIASYAVFYTRVDFEPGADRVDSRTAKELYAFLMATTDQNEGILSWKPRGLALFTGRRVGKFPTGSPEAVVARARELRAPVLVARSDESATESLVARRISGLRETFRNADYVVYRLPR